MTASLLRPVRIGAVRYLNSKPLIEGLPEFASDAELSLDYPSRLADDLAGGQLDVALVPSIEVVANPDYEIISDACVATRGPVLSVKLYSRVSPGKIRTLALDEGSRTSSVLAQILLAKRWGVSPKLEPLPVGRSVEATDADAVLLIGDRAMRPPKQEFVAIWDLGSEWLDWTGLPFVFAVWAARADTNIGPVEAALVQARDRGVEQLESIARREAPLLGIPEKTALDYLRNNLTYHLASAEKNGFQLFQRLAVEMGFAREGVELDLRNIEPAGQGG